MNTILIASVVLLVVILVVAFVVFRPGKDFNPEREREQAAPLNSDGPVMMRYPGGPQDENEPVQDVLSFNDGPGKGKLPTGAPRPMAQDMLQTMKPGGKPNAIPLPKGGPIIRPIDPAAQRSAADDAGTRPNDSGPNA